MMFLCAFAGAETVFVTITNGSGELVLPRAEIEVRDFDGDGTVTLDDALVCAHDAAYDGGAAAGYYSEDTEYGRSIYKLWGEENGGSYGYYVNNASAFSPLDPIQDGDLVHAYAYQDLVSWSDTYCFFQTEGAEMKAGEEIALTLTALVFDENWNQLASAVEGAVITVNGEDSEWTTGADGACSVSFSEPGEYVISARSENMTLVPPVCVVTVI